jgi:hypothetical protein
VQPKVALSDCDLPGLPLGGNGVEDDRNHVFHGIRGMAGGFPFLRGRLGKLLQMPQIVIVQGLEPFAHAEPVPRRAGGQKAQEARREAQMQPVDADFD